MKIPHLQKNPRENQARGPPHQLLKRGPVSAHALSNQRLIRFAQGPLRSSKRTPFGQMARARVSECPAFAGYRAGFDGGPDDLRTTSSALSIRLANSMFSLW